MKELVVVHGWAYSVDSWTETVRYLEKAGVKVRMLHVPGLTSPSDEVWDIDGYVEWLHEQLAGIKKPIALGHSNGGRILLNYAAKHPTALRHMILLNSAGVWEDERKIGRKRKILRTGAHVLKPLRHVKPLRTVLYRLVGAEDYDKAPDNMKQTLRNMLASDQHLDLGAVTAPATLLWGAEDVMTPKAQGKKMQRLLKGSVLKIIPGWRHAPYKTHPRELADEILLILETIKA